MSWFLEQIRGFRSAGAGVPSSLVEEAIRELLEPGEYAWAAVRDHVPPGKIRATDVDIWYCRTKLADCDVWTSAAEVNRILRDAAGQILRERGYSWSKRARKWVREEGDE